jgi:glutamyl-tRNA reductase
VGKSSDSPVDWLAKKKLIDREIVASSSYTHAGRDAVRHLFRVASGLDSMVLGETQILGQLKNARRASENCGALGLELQKIMDASFSVAKVVRSKTKIGADSISIPSAVLRVARRIFGGLEESKILFIGAGEMIRLCADYLCSQQNSGLFFANRTSQRALELAQHYSGTSIDLAAVSERLSEYDILVSCTGSDEPLLNKVAFEKSVSKRKYKPLLAIDLAVPRDIHPDVDQVREVFLYTIDDLGEIISEAQKNRSEAAAAAGHFVEEGIDRLDESARKRTIAPVVTNFRQFASELREAEVQKALKQLHRGADPEEVIISLSRAILNKFLHLPSHVLNSSDQEEQEALAEALSKLYKLDLRK